MSRLLIALSTVACACFGCGGGGGSQLAEGGMGGSGVSMGRATSFEPLVVNGQTFDTSSSEFVYEEEPAGEPGDDSGIRAGMVVRVSARFSPEGNLATQVDPHTVDVPIAAITGYAELFAEGGVEPGPALDRAMARISEASNRAERLIEDLLALARLDREIGVSRERIDLSALAVDITEDLRVGTGREMSCAAQAPVVVDGDRVWLRQAIEPKSR